MQTGGVPKYWVVDPDAYSVKWFQTESGRFLEAKPVADEIEFACCGLNVSVDLQ